MRSADHFGSNEPAVLNTFEKRMTGLLFAELAQAYYCEKRLGRVLHEWALVAHLPELKQLFRDQARLTNCQILRLQAMFRERGEVPRELPCRAMEGFLEQTSETMELIEHNSTRDRHLIARTHKAIFMMMAAYQSIIQLARSLGQVNVQRIASTILTDAMSADQRLKEIDARAILTMSPENAFSTTTMGR